MMRLRLVAASVTLAGGALLASAEPASSTMTNKDFGLRYCCGYDANRDGRADSWCCYDTGCSSSSRGCLRVT